MVAVRHYDYNRDTRHCLSLLSLQESRANTHLNLPFGNDTGVHGMRCRGKLYFYDGVGNSSIHDLTKGHVKTLSPPALDHVPDMVMYGGCGMGYDATHNDYKVIRNYAFAPDDTWAGSTDSTELYSLRRDTWKTIPTIDAFVDAMSPIYIETEDTGCCYWVAHLGDSFRGIVSFDFTRETYGYFHLPETDILDPIHTLVTFGDSLGVIVSPRPHYESCSSCRVDNCSVRCAQIFSIYSWEDDDWVKYDDISVHPWVQRPLNIINGQFMFVEFKTNNSQHNQLAFYDLHSLDLKMFNIFGRPRRWDVFSVDESAIHIFRD